ncbi:MAG: leucine-rich repeat domain-containing protein, partial [Muribaculaceae bacterium]|nr:leucine-rich repeat domain-containing protein [Muribaculaceae bacterium]
MKRQTNYYALMRLLVCCLIGISSLWSYAATEVTIGDLKYELDDATKEATVMCLVSENVTSVTIPEKVSYDASEYSVTSIGYSAFKGYIGLTSLSIPNSVNSIGNYAFEGCSGLKKLTIEDGETVLSLGYQHNTYYNSDSGLFDDCPLESIYLGRNLIVDKGSLYCLPFSFKTTLTSLTIGNSVTSIGNYAFYKCSGLTSLTIGNSVTSVGDYAFYYCSGLTSLTIPNSVTLVGGGAFKGCSGLKNLIIEDGEKELSLGYNDTGKGLFYDCPLESVYLGRDLNYRTGQEYGHSPFYLKTTLTSLTIGNSVTLIRECAFYNCSGLTSLTIGNSVTSIGSDAFSGCSGLTSLTISNSVTTISQFAFQGCSGLISLTIPNSVTNINHWAFNGCTGIKNLVIEDGEKELYLGYNPDYPSATGLFYHCPLESVYLGRNLIYESGVNYGYSPFYSKTTLTSLTIGNSVTSIGDYAFYYCSGLTELTIGNSVTTIGEYAFSGCSGLTKVSFASIDSLCRISFGNFTSNPLYYAHQLYIDDKEVTSVIIPETIFSIGNYTFCGCSNLTEVTIPNSVTSISGSAFNGCSNLSTIKTYSYVIEGIENCGLPKSTNVFLLTQDDGKYDLSNINLLYFDKVLVEKEGIKYSLVTAPDFFEFTNCLASDAGCFLVQTDKDCIAKDPRHCEYSYFKGENIGDKLASDEGFSFIPSKYHVENVFTCIDEGIEFSKEVSLSSAGTLFDKVGLQDIEKVDKLKITGDLNGTDIMTINRMKSLKWLDISDANIVAGGTTYRENLKTENDVIGSYFFNDVELKVLKLSNSANVIDQNAFKGMNSLVSVEIGSQTIEIRESAFSGCSKFGELTIPASVTSVGNYAFDNCYSLKKLTIEDEEKSLSLGYNYYSSSSTGQGLFYDCPLEKVYLGRNLSYSYSPFSSKITLTSLTIGNSVTSIGASAFSGCNGLTSLNIGDSVTSIGSSAFSGCSGLIELSIPNFVTTINSSVFSGCSGLKSLTIPNYVTTIGESAFSGCSGLIEVIIPNSVTSIGSSAFSSCYSLTKATFGSLESLCKINFGNEYSNPLFYAHHLYIDGVEVTSILVPEDIHSIGTYTFINCTELTDLTLPNSVSSIGSWAFNGCARLRNIIIEDGEKELSLGYNSYSSSSSTKGKGLFYDCPLETLYLGRNLSYEKGSNYGYSPFYSKNILTSLTIGNLVTSIGESAFYGCSSLISLTIGDSVTSIGSSAFSGCSGLTSLTIGNSVTSIGSSVFSCCSDLTELTIPNSVTSIGSS